MNVEDGVTLAPRLNGSAFESTVSAVRATKFHVAHNCPEGPLPIGNQIDDFKSPQRNIGSGYILFHT